MTIRDTNDPEISFDPSGSTRPTAPPAPTDATDDVPIANATAIPIVSATAVPVEPNQASLTDGSAIERTTNTDGALTVKVTKTTTQSDGFRSIRIEEYLVPSNMAQTVIQSMDMTGEAPSSLYLTKIEDHRLPPDQVAGSTVQAGSTAYPFAGPSAGVAAATGGAANTSTTPPVDYEARQKCMKQFAVTGVFVAVGLIAFFAIQGSQEITWDDDYFNSNPTYPTSNDDYFFSPSYPSQPIWSPSYPSTGFTLPPDLFKPFPPTKSPSPTSTPYPTWDLNEFHFTLSPGMFDIPSPSPVAKRNGADTNNDSDTQGRFDQAVKNDKIKVTPAIISPTFIRKPTRRPENNDGSNTIDVEQSSNGEKIMESA